MRRGLRATRAGAWLERSPLFNVEQPGRKPLLITAASLWLPSILWLAAFRPGLMSPDSIDQWHQAVHGGWVDHHPPAYTALLWISSWLTGSPFLVAVLQTVAIAAAIAALGFALLRMGASRWAVGLLSSVVVLSPMVGTFGVTIWKDVPYTAVFLFVSATACLMVQSELDHRRDDRDRRLVHLSVLACGLVALRQNGVILAVVLLLAVVVILRPGWRLSLLAVGIPMLVIGGLKLVVYPVAGIKASSVRDNVALLVHDIAAVQKADNSVFNGSDRATMARLAPVSDWARLYDATGCSTSDWEFLVPEAEHAFDGQFQAVVRVWLHAFSAKPAVVIRNHLCLSAVAWNPVIVGKPSTVPDGVSPNDDGLRAQPLSEGLQHFALSLRSRTKQSTLRVALLWRAVPWMYLAYGAVVFAARRAKRRLLIMVGAPLLALQVSVGLVTPAQDARYMFAGLVTSVLLLPIMSVPSRAHLAAQRSPDDQGLPWG